MAFFDVAPLPVHFDVWAYVTDRCHAMFADPAEVRGPRRYPRLVKVRSVIATELRQRDMSLPEIGRALGGRHHTTIMNLLGYFDSRRT